MLANHTGISTLFRRILKQYEAMRKRGAHLEHYRKEESFELGEFDEAREVAMGLVAEYEAAEGADYLNGGSGAGEGGGGGGGREGETVGGA